MAGDVGAIASLARVGRWAGGGRARFGRGGLVRCMRHLVTATRIRFDKVCASARAAHVAASLLSDAAFDDGDGLDVPCQCRCSGVMWCDRPRWDALRWDAAHRNDAMSGAALSCNVVRCLP